MNQLKRKILDIIFWVALVVGIVMILWRIFGDSPTDLVIVVPFIVMLFSRVWTMNNEFKDFRYQVRTSFDKVREDMNRIENKIDNLNKKV